MPTSTAPRPMILVRGFGGVSVDDERRNAYQGFNDGTVYPGRRGDNFIYEGFVLRALKSPLYRYTDATNVIGYYAKDIDPPSELVGYEAADASGRVAIDPRMADAVLRDAGPGTIWIYRYYDLDPRSLENYGNQLVRLIALIETAITKSGATFSGVDIVAHSMGGLVVRAALKAMKGKAGERINKIVTLGTPHRGIAFQGIPRWVLQALPKVNDAEDEIAAFDPESTSFTEIAEHDLFDLDRILTVVGTDYQSYNNSAATLANRLSTMFETGSLATNRSDGLVKQAAAQLPGAPRTFIHKCHGGPDSLVTSREAYEIAMRFFHGSHRARLWLDEAEVRRGHDRLGKSEFYFGVSIKTRDVDFALFNQSPEAENCYGPFSDDALREGPPYLTELLKSSYRDSEEHGTTGWLDEQRLIWEGWIDERAVRNPEHPDMVFRFDIFVGERDSYGVGFSDNVVFRKQYYAQVIPQATGPRILVHTGEAHLRESPEASLALVEPESGIPSLEVTEAKRSDDGFYRFEVGGTGFTATLRVGIERLG